METRLQVTRTLSSLGLTISLLLAGCGQSDEGIEDAPVVKPAPTSGKAPETGPAPATGVATGQSKDKYAYYGKGEGFTPIQQTGRDTWIMWTGGNQAFFRLGSEKAGSLGIPVEYFRLLDSRERPNRFRRLGMVNEPNFRQATEPDEYGLWLDQWLGDDTYPDTKVYGLPTGIVGLRKFPNPKFDKSKWNVQEYYRKPNSIEPPYLVGMACGVLPHGI